MINEFLILQFLATLSLLFFNRVINILSLWLLSGFYLILSGLITFLEDFDIFIGFLWLIDLGIGLIFFIFILHFSAFLNQKSLIELSSKFFLMSLLYSLILVFLFYVLSRPFESFHNFNIMWFFFISWYDYYEITNTTHNSELNLLREVFFFKNAFEFFFN